MKKRTIPEMKYQLMALKWRLRAHSNGTLLGATLWTILAVGLGLGLDLYIAGALAGATGFLIIKGRVAHLMIEQDEYLDMVIEFDEMMERGERQS